MGSEHLNFFYPYDRKKSHHEDQLTRAFLVLVRLVPLVRAAFIDMVREYQRSVHAENVLPAFFDSDMTSIQTQKQELPAAGDWTTLIAVLITTEPLDMTRAVTRREGKATYDGILHLGDFVLTIENKPWRPEGQDQLDPHVPEDLEDIVIEKQGVLILWNQLLERLLRLVEGTILDETHRGLLEDFFSLVQQNFPKLSPYSRLSVCRRRPVPVHQRLRTILERLPENGYPDIQASGRDSRSSNLPYQYIRLLNWGIDRAYLVHREKAGSVSEVRLDLHPGDTMNQARHLYRNLKPEALLALHHEEGWQVDYNIHFAYQSKNLLWVNPDPGKMPIESYIQVWQQHVDQIKQVHRGDDDGLAYFSSLVDQGFAREEELEPMHQLFTKTKREKLNFCPGLSIYRTWSIEEAEGLDEQQDKKGGRFVKTIRREIDRALKTWEGGFVPLLQKV